MSVAPSFTDSELPEVAKTPPPVETYCNNRDRAYNAPVVAMPKGHVLIAGKGIQILTIQGGTVSAQTWETVAEYLA